MTKNGSDFQPRVGVIWNPTGDGKLVVRGAYAVMVNQSNTGYFVGEAEQSAAHHAAVGAGGGHGGEQHQARQRR